MPETPTFATPPVVELVLGVQFSPLARLTSGHFGLFWKELGAEWIKSTDGPVLGDQFELFGDNTFAGWPGIQVRLEPLRLPGRFLVEHQSEDRTIQIQATRYHLNWQKRNNIYPTYKKLIAEFSDTFKQFVKFAEKHELGKVEPNQWELTYINAFPHGQDWRTLADWSRLLPGLFGNLFPTEGLGIVLERRGAEWSYEIEPRRGRLHVTARPARRVDETRDSLLLQITARGPVGNDGARSVRDGLDLGHEIAVGTFLKVVDKDTQKTWGVVS